MKLNAYTDVCLRVLMSLARGGGGRRMTSQQVADSIDVPYNHVIKAVSELRRRELIHVTRGRLGGAVITEAGLDLRVGALVRDLSTRPEVIDCDGLESGHPCPLAAACSLRGALARAREAFLAELDGVRIRDLVPGAEVALGLPAMPTEGAEVPSEEIDM